MIGSIITRKITLKGKPVNSLILQSPDTTKWIFAIHGASLRSHSGAAGAVTDIKITGGSDISSEASLGVSNLGELLVKNGVDLSGTATLNDDFTMKSSEDNKIYKITISADDEIQLIEV